MILINGNGNPYQVELPMLQIQHEMNDAALERIKENTGLHFTRNGWGFYNAQPTDAEQIVKLLLTYNFKTRYYNNWQLSNTLLLKHDHHTGFDVDSICYDCMKHNHISTHDLKQGDRLAC